MFDNCFSGKKTTPDEWSFFAPVTLDKQLIRSHNLRNPNSAKINASLYSISSFLGSNISVPEIASILLIKKELKTPPPVISTELFFCITWLICTAMCSTKVLKTDKTSGKARILDIEGKKIDGALAEGNIIVVIF